MSENTLKIKISGKLDYEDDLSVAQAARIITFLNTDDRGLDASDSFGSGSNTGDTDKGTPPKVTSPRQALEASRAKTNPEKIVALAAYVLQDGGETFKLEAIKPLFQRARATMPGNLTRDLTSAIGSGWIAESNVASEYYLTDKVANVLESGFPEGVSGGVTKGKSKTSSARKRTKGPATKPDVFVGIDDFSVTMDGLPGYHEMKSDKDKVLWVLESAKKLGIKGLANRDIAWLTDHLGAGVPAGNITGAFNTAQKQGYASRSTMNRTLRILPTGRNFLATLDKKHSRG